MPQSKKKIIIPHPKTLTNDIKLYDLVLKILSLNKFKPILSKKIKKVRKNKYPIITQYSELVGQKENEEFVYDNEITNNETNHKILSIKFQTKIKKINFVKNLIKFDTKTKMVKKIREKYKFFTPKKKSKKISSLI